MAGTFALLVLASTASAVDRMDDWVGQNTNSGNQFGNGQSLFAPDNNYDIISAVSVGGQLQSKINFTTADDPPEPIIPTLDTPFIFLADQSLEGGARSYEDELSMTGTITFQSDQATEPNICFCWYSSENTAHRIGLGISNRTVSQGGALVNRLRMDFGYAASGGNRFYYASNNGAQANTEVESTVPDGSYNFAFTYAPPNPPDGAGGTMSLTLENRADADEVVDYFRTVSPMETTPWDLDFFELDRFGIVQRATANQTQLGFYDVQFSNVTYTGGTAVVEQSGDHNDDGLVDAADYVAYRKDPANNGGDPRGRYDFVEHFGEPDPGSGGSGGVPEPGSLMLCLFAVVGWVFSGRISRRR
jgi:hypothetical protein